MWCKLSSLSWDFPKKAKTIKKKTEVALQLAGEETECYVKGRGPLAAGRERYLCREKAAKQL